MVQSADDTLAFSRRYALCVGIGTYTNLSNRNLRYAVADATTIAKRLADPQRGNFVVTLLTQQAQTSKAALDRAVEDLLSAVDRQAEDLTVIYFSCHGDVHGNDNTFCLLPSNTTLQIDGTFEQTTVISIDDIARWLSRAKTHNIVMLLDVCHSGGAGVALQHFKLDLSTGPNFFIIGAARQDQVTRQSSQLQHGLFTHCLLRAFEQLPTKDGWLTISQISNFISEEMPWFAKDHPIQIQSWSVSVNPQLPMVRNPCYPELSPLPPLWNVPFPRNPFFTGQDGVLSQLANLLQSEQKTALTQPQAITGLGGIGKTQLALEYAYQHRQDYHAILWGRADTREALISTFVSIAHLLGLPEEDEKDQMVTVEAVKTWLAGRSKWLFILDNTDELALAKDFIPPAFQGHLLLTTRAQVMGGLAHKLEVEVMRPETGALLLLRRASLIAPDAPLEQASPADVTVAKELSEEMGGLPLALDQAGAYIEEVSCSPQDYRRLYQIRRAELLKERGGVMPDHPESVATTWSLAFQKVEQGNPAASDLLRLCAFLHPDAIPEEMITKGAEHLGPQLQAMASDPLGLNKAIRALRAYSLLHRDSATHTLTIHRLVQAVLKESMNKQTQREWAERAVRAIDRAFPDVQVAFWPHCQRYLPHTLACAALIHQQELVFPEAAHLLHQTAHYLHERGQYGQVEVLLQHALVIYEKLRQAEHPNTARTLHELATFYLNQGQYAQAEPLYQHALTIREKTLGLEHTDTARTLHQLAQLYQDQGRYVQAEPLYLRALAIKEKALGPEHPSTASTLHDLAALYQAQGQYAQAESLYLRVLTISEKVLGPQHPHTASTLGALAQLYQNQGQHAQAEPLYLRALSIYEQVLGPKHPSTGTILHELARLYQNQGQYAQAEPLYLRALSIYEQVLIGEHPSIAATLHQLATLYQDQGQYAQAEPLYLRALTIKEKVLGPEHPDIAATLHALAALHRMQGQYTQAEPLYLRALTIREKVLGSEHPDTARTLYQLALLYQDQDQYTQAEPLYLRALTIREKVLGLEHPDTARTLHSYADLLRKTKRESEAAALEARTKLSF